jgi:hypothetical protein
VDRSELSPEQERIVSELFDAFRDRDYPDCLARVFDLGMTLGARVYTVILINGIKFEIQREPSLQAIMIHTIAHLRLGDQTGAEAAFMMNSMAGGEIRRWLTTLLA